MNFVRRLQSNPVAFASGVCVLVVIFIALTAPWIAPYAPIEMITAIRFATPGTPGYLLGSDEFGRDVLSRIIYGARISLLVAATAVLLAVVVGGSLGVLSGFVGGWTDNVVMRFMDVMFA